MPTPPPSTNSTAAFGTVAPSVSQTTTGRVTRCAIKPCEATDSNRMRCSPRGTMWWSCGNGSGNDSSKMRACVNLSSPLNLFPGSNRETRSSGEVRRPPSCITWSKTERRSTTSHSLPSTPGPTKLFLPGRTSHQDPRTRKHRHLLVLWPGEMQDPSSVWSLPSRLTLPQRRQTHLPPLSNLCGTRTTQTADPTELSMLSHRLGTVSRGYLAHA